MNERESLRAVWQAVQHRWDATDWEGTQPATEEEIQAAEAAIAREYAEHIPACPPFAFPEMLRAFLGLVGSSRHSPCSGGSGVYGFNWHTPRHIAGETKFLNDLWWDEYEPEKGLWACVAHWSDKHDIWMCCQPGHPQFGALVDCHDGHPWVDQYPEGDSLADFLRQWGAWRDEEPGDE
jgi:hypothetical protein